YLSPIASPLLD
nr:Chain C, Peptide Y16R [Toxoplasma gondii]